MIGSRLHLYIACAVAAAGAGACAASDACPAGTDNVCLTGETGCFCSSPCSGAGSCPVGQQCLTLTDGTQRCAPLNLDFGSGASNGMNAPLAGTSWTCANIVPAEAEIGVTSSVFAVNFNADGTWTSVLQITYGASAAMLAGCTEVTNTRNGNYAVTAGPNGATGSFSVVSTDPVTTRTGCLTPSDDGTMTGVYSGEYNGGATSFTISGNSMSMSGDSGVPFDGSGPYLCSRN